MRFLILLVLASTGLFADPINLQGGGSFGKDKLESIHATGVIKLNGTEIQNQLQITGSLIARDAEIGSLDILGEANLTDSHVRQSSTVLGQIQTIHTTFDNPITILSTKSIFTSSKLKEIIVKKDEAFKGKQIIELRQKTLVDGPITFESGKGEVRVFPGSQVLGKVNGGKVIKKY